MQATSPLARVLRSLRRSPGFVAIATLSMGIALGLSTSVFAVMDAMTHPDPPFRDVGQLYNVSFGVNMQTPPPADEIVRNVLALDMVERTAGWRFGWDEMVILGGRVGRTSVGHAGPGYFDLLGVRPRLGRLFGPDDHERMDVAIVTDMVWRRDYANRARIGDASVQMGNRMYPIVGVLPAGTDRSLGGDIYVPDSTRRMGMAALLVRLKPGYTVAQFQPRVKEMNERLAKAFGSPKDRGISAYIRTLRPDPLMVRDFHRAMIGAAMCILLIACANVAALMLARGVVKRRDYALRLALGARPIEIAREVVAEVGILAIAGCVAGAVVTSWFVGLIGRAMPPEMEWQGFVQPQWSWRVLALAMGAVVTSVAVAGGFPAWMASRTDPAGPLKESSGGNTGRAGTRFRWLVMAELAIAMTLLMSTSLMLKSIRMMERYDFGYANARLLRAVVGAPWRQDSISVEDGFRLQQQGLEAVRAVPGVEAAIPNVGTRCGHPILMSDRSVEGGATLNLLQNLYRGSGGCTSVGPHFFSTLGLRIVDGRDFEEGDAAPDAAGAVILDEKTATRLFPHERAVGRTIRFGNGNSTEPWIPVVGVVKNHMLGFDPHPEMGADSAATVFLVQAPRVRTNRAGQSRGSRSMSFIVRTGPNVDEVSLRVMRALVPLTPAQGRAGVIPWDDDFRRQLRTEEFLSLVFTLLGLASLLLGAAGLYSVISYVASQRMREFAVRIALGATKENVVRLVLREAFTMAIGGTAVGAGLGMWAAFLLWERMWGIYPVDVEALVIAELTLIVVTMVACIVPALRAARSDPLEIIRAA
jgi:predicted permease